MGVWGWKHVRWDAVLVFSTVRNRLQPFATILQRQSWQKVAVPMGSFARGVIFGRFQRCVVAFRVAGMARRDMWTCLVTCRASFDVKGAIFLRRCQKMCCVFPWQAQHFGRVQLHLAWQAQHFRRVVLRVLCLSHCQGCVKWWPKANSVARLAFCEM